MSRLRPAQAYLLILLAFALRLFQIGEWSFWHDEALTVLLARQPIPELLAITAKDVHPPLYFLLVKLMLIFGQSETIIRLVSAISSAGAVWLVYLIGRDNFSRKMGLVSGLIMAVAPLQIFYAQEARLYGLLLLLTCLTSWAFLRALSINCWPSWGLFIISGTLASYSAYFIFPVFGAMGIYVVLAKRQRSYLTAFGLSLAIMGLLYLPWLGVFLRQTQSVADSFWLARPSMLTLFTTLSGFLIGNTLSVMWAIIGLVATLLIIFILLNAVRHQLKPRSNDRSHLIWLLCWLSIPLLSTYLISLIRPIYQIRTVLTVSPALYLLIGWGLTQAPQRRFNQLLFLPVIIIMLVSLQNFYFNASYAKPRWREAALYLQQQIELTDTVIHTSTGSYLPFTVYLQASNHRLLAEDPASAQENPSQQAVIEAMIGMRPTATEVMQGLDEVWLVVALDHAVDYQLAQKSYFDTHFNLVVEENVAGVMILHYHRYGS